MTIFGACVCVYVFVGVWVGVCEYDTTWECVGVCARVVCVGVVVLVLVLVCLCVCVCVCVQVLSAKSKKKK